MKAKFWYSAHQRELSEYVDKDPILRPVLPSQGKHYAVIDGCLLEFTESHVPDSEQDDYAPNYDDAVFLGFGEYACTDWNIQTYLKRHPEVSLGRKEEWPEVIGGEQPKC